ncbi:hypothetical protein [Lysobacter enzymogenes]|uniref:Uncharacterized protein n=1 Tax=Lysobacter enzymogenes TaxID=69 RepID=A0AAU9ALR5_LYSEN|nr:hypothetical protein [Lysobacter enzymogenes]BAV97548.1 hypothetical protein LEN_2061 [Lysobacter enzymogenes]
MRADAAALSESLAFALSFTDPRTRAIAMDATPPPLPPRLRESFADRPDLLERLQRTLATASDFEAAKWHLEDLLSAFIAEARDALAAAQARADPAAVALAQRDLQRRFLARSANGGLGDLDELWEHFRGEPNAR